MRTILCLLTFLLVLPAHAQPGIEGAEAPFEVIKHLNRTCYVYARYLVGTEAYKGEVGERIIVARRDSSSSTAPMCATLSESALFTREEPGDARYFFGIWGPYLFVDSGTGPEDRGLEIFEVERGVKTYNGIYFSNDPVEMREPGRLTLFQSLQGDQGQRRCPEMENEGWTQTNYWFEEQVVLDVRTGNVERTGKVKCSYRM